MPASVVSFVDHGRRPLPASPDYFIEPATTTSPPQVLQSIGILTLRAIRTLEPTEHPAGKPGEATEPRKLRSLMRALTTAIGTPAQAGQRGARPELRTRTPGDPLLPLQHTPHRPAEVERARKDERWGKWRPGDVEPVVVEPGRPDDVTAFGRCRPAAFKASDARRPPRPRSRHERILQPASRGGGSNGTAAGEPLPGGSHRSSAGGSSPNTQGRAAGTQGIQQSSMVGRIGRGRSQPSPASLCGSRPTMQRRTMDAERRLPAWPAWRGVPPPEGRGAAVPELLAAPAWAGIVAADFLAACCGSVGLAVAGRVAGWDGPAEEGAWRRHGRR